MGRFPISDTPSKIQVRSTLSANGGGTSKISGTSSSFANSVGPVLQKLFGSSGSATSCSVDSRLTSQWKARGSHQLSRFDARISYPGLSSKLFSRFLAGEQRSNASSALAGLRSALERV